MNKNLCETSTPFKPLTAWEGEKTDALQTVIQIKE